MQNKAKQKMYKSQVLYLKEEEKMHPKTVAGSQTNMTMKYNEGKKWGSTLQSHLEIVFVQICMKNKKQEK